MKCKKCGKKTDSAVHNKPYRGMCVACATESADDGAVLRLGPALTATDDLLDLARRDVAENAERRKK